MHTVADTLLKSEAEDHETFMLNLPLQRFKQRYADQASGNGDAFVGATDLEPGNYEWQRRFLIPAKGMAAVDLLCCPEDVERSKRCRHREEELCADCSIPLCSTCAETLLLKRGTKHVIPMGQIGRAHV